MPGFEFIVKLSVERDLDEIWLSIAQFNIEAADELVDTLNQRIQSLGMFPKRGSLREDIFPKVRILIEGKYIIVYRIQGHLVEILRIIHGARDLNDLDLI